MCEKLERIQRRAVKWILSEPDHHYNDIEYLARLRDLDLLPLRYRFMFSDLVLFHKIYNNDSCIKLPSYLQPFTDADRNRLRSNIRPPTYFQDSTTINLDGTRRGSLPLGCMYINKFGPTRYVHLQNHNIALQKIDSGMRNEVPFEIV